MENPDLDQLLQKFRDEEPDDISLSEGAPLIVGHRGWLDLMQQAFAIAEELGS